MFYSIIKIRWVNILK